LGSEAGNSTREKARHRIVQHTCRVVQLDKLDEMALWLMTGTPSDKVFLVSVVLEHQARQSGKLPGQSSYKPDKTFPYLKVWENTRLDFFFSDISKELAGQSGQKLILNTLAIKTWVVFEHLALDFW
jgi:hypothetical protein